MEYDLQYTSSSQTLHSRQMLQQWMCPNRSTTTGRQEDGLQKKNLPFILHAADSPQWGAVESSSATYFVKREGKSL